MNNQKFRESYLYKNYFADFYAQQKVKVKEKIVWTIKLVETLQILPEEYFKHLETTDGLYEIRVKLGSDIFRIFSFFDEGKLIILANGFQKKTQKTPRQEIEKAEKIKKEYFAEKQRTKKNKNNEK
jgi:phage-related protein